ncbi:MAG TPA: beta-eliminating lyase-related protein, partial [Polyangiaceae bacterium]|nr:beta-eliminating lyase-related protein [Polyangiaceae bacterium]
MTLWDLRSDTVTKPSAGMRRAMAEAEVGDDVYGEDPSVRALQERVADLLGKEQALFVPSGTMANQIALLLHTRPGDEVIVGERAHCVWYESGAGAAWSGVQFAIAGRGGLFSAEQLCAAIKPKAPHFPNTS